MAWKDHIEDQVSENWHLIGRLFLNGTTVQQATDLLWDKFRAKFRHVPDAVVVLCELEILLPMPWKCTAYRKKDGKWIIVSRQGKTPLTAHVVGEVEFPVSKTGKGKGKTGKKVTIYHRFIGKCFPQYTSKTT
jgi:hypothetical protein